MSDKRIETINVEKITPYEKNSKAHPEEQINKIKKSIQEFGFQQPILIDENNQIIAGHGRLLAAQSLLLETVPCIIITGMSEERKKAFRIMDNKSAESEWHVDFLKEEFQILEDEGYDLDLTGFGFDEIAKIMNKTDNLQDVEPEQAEKIKTDIKLGDVYGLGRHRLMCGDVTKEQQLTNLMDEQKADLLFTDPPYGVDYSGKNEFLNKIDKGNRIQEDIVEDEIKDMSLFLTNTLANIKEHLNEYNAIYITFAGSTLIFLLNTLKELDFKLHQILVWVKNNHVLGRTDYAYKHEFIVYGWYGKHKYYGGFCPTTWEIDRPLKAELHPTMKPIELCAKAISNSTKEDMKVLDPFGGSGSTLIACEQLKRTCYMMEIEPKYCQVIINRWEKLTGNKATKL